MGDLVTHIINKVGLGVLNREAGDFLQHLKLALFDKSNFFLLRVGSGNLAVQRVALLLHGVNLAVKSFLFLL